MFVCGPTVYNYCHLGHAKTYIAFDVIAKYLRFKGYSLFLLINITDIAETLIERSKELGISFLELSKKYEKYFFKDLKSLRIESVDAFGRASDQIQEIIDQITGLIKKGFAYETETGVYFNVKKYPDYGYLSRQTPEEISLRPLELCSKKKNPEDFSLWKKIDEDPKWDSPWGFGRPGWHIEDTAIAMKFLGPQYDLHGGGVELIFPHHEAEIAQGEALSGKKPYVRYWLHTGLLKIKMKKMSKSLENIICIRDLLKSYDYRVLRFYLLSKHYRQPINFSKAKLRKSREKLQRLTKSIENFENLPTVSNPSNKLKLIKNLEKLETAFKNSLDDDFNTPKALKTIQRMAKILDNFAKNNNEINECARMKSLESIRRLADVLGIL